MLKCDLYTTQQCCGARGPCACLLPKCSPTALRVRKGFQSEHSISRYITEFDGTNKFAYLKWNNYFLYHGRRLCTRRWFSTSVSCDSVWWRRKTRENNSCSQTTISPRRREHYDGEPLRRCLYNCAINSMEAVKIYDILPITQIFE